MTQQQAENMVYFREKTSPNTPAVSEPMMPPTCSTDVSQPVALADAVTEGKLAWNRAMTSDWPSTPCW